ncbi:MAG TPA: hypothetical protein VIJ22_20980 [Polyangiaceae bacterium]
MIRRKALAVLLVAPLAVAATGLLAGCPAAATTTAYTPITGILIRSSSLVAGYGCGTGDDQVFQYGAFLSYVDDVDAGTHGPAVYSGVFDCYSDGIFSNLPTDDAGSLNFSLTIVAWNQTSFPVTTLSCDPSSVGEAGFTTCPGDSPDTLVNNEGTPNWLTTCTATQESGVSVLAVCAPLTPTKAGASDAGSGEASAETDAPAAGAAVVVDTHGFVAADGGTLVCGSDYQNVRATYSGAQSGIVSAECPAPLSIAPPTVAGGAYSLTVELFQSGVAVAQTVCQATASATGPTTASCAPATGP